MRPTQLSGNLPHSTRNENQIAQDILLALRNTGYGQLGNVDIAVHGNHVRLQGKLPSYYLKQRAHHAALQVPGVQTLDDEIAVAG